MRVAAEITLSKQEHRKLERWASARSASVRLRERARIVLMAAQGMTNKAIAAELGTDANKVGRWRSRVAKEGMSCIEKERPRGANHGGKDSKSQAELRSQVLEATTQAIPKDATHWSCRSVEKTVPKEQEIHIVLDNYSTHKHEKVLAWIERKKRIFLHFIPTSASWANLVERFFAILTQKQIRRGVFTSVPDLEKCLREYLHSYNENPRPLVWTKAVDEILEKVGRGRAALPGAS